MGSMYGRVRPDWTDRVALITGASGDIGRAVAVALAGLGMRLTLSGRDPGRLDQTAQAARAAGCKEILLLPGDLTQPDCPARCVAQAAKELGGLDVLVNNAGLAQSAPFGEIAPAAFDRIMAVNVRAPFFFCQAALPHLVASGLGTVINVGSVVSHKGYPLQAAYAASKHALLGMSKSLAAEVYTQNVRVHVICPGGVYTDMVRQVRPDLAPEGLIAPEEIADIALFFLEHRGNGVVDEINVHRAGKAPFA